MTRKQYVGIEISVLACDEYDVITASIVGTVSDNGVNDITWDFIQ